jgi:hypothetical protein
MGKTSDRYKDRCDESRVRENWPFKRTKKNTERMKPKRKPKNDE